MKKKWTPRRQMKRRKKTSSVKTHYVYELFNEATRQTFYIGRTTNPTTRIARHHSSPGNSAVAVYIREAQDAEQRVSLYVLDSIRTDEIETAKALESCWLQLAEATGANLMNGIRASSGATPNMRLVVHQLAMIHRYPVSAERKRVASQQIMRSMPWVA